MYQKILVPLDGSKEAEGVLPTIQGLLSPEGQGILLHVIPSGWHMWMGQEFLLTAEEEEEERARAMAYLRAVASQAVGLPGRWVCEVLGFGNVADRIVDFASREQVDLIAMYTHGRKGLAKLFKGSVAETVQKRASTKVCVVGPGERARRQSPAH
ncbi:MAG: universal stress protein [Dehalococcoidia bacterium]